ncbi:hypothetical protein Skr01_17820 [Sphaerisporangium krabiense]|uniref:Pimeloyl-ACP methyl ester carboxylesterase n=1 Tax=Sphaerisporangium krabiense TaxID=763782 RepID=A0A7W8YYZ7_9ACTN|nr:alpha/beta fold hydrolase [Sphaerisporangium krabiense]MBB5624350.1 pimeloyl-ACP methyl ester carboxylesterase [Sphaerisporangium krabiense]GII61697.1 hypothetical protein Skr01_17820 [Sphaerisporangium krabiense]
MTPDVVPLPDRSPEITGSLPAPFRRAQLDAARPAFALTPAGPVVSTDAWSDRHLALLADGRWTRLTSGSRWNSRPEWTGGRLVAEVFQDLAAEQASSLPIPLTGVRAEPEHAGPRAVLTADGRAVAHPVAGEVRLPPGATAECVVPALPGHDRIALLLRQGRARRVVCVDRDGVTHWDGPVTSAGPWLSEHEVVVVLEAWPGRVPHAWDVRSGTLRRLVEPAQIVVDDVRADGDLVGLSWTSAGQPRRLELVEAGRLAAGEQIRLSPVPPGPGGLPSAVSTVFEGSHCPLPTLLRDPPGQARGTVLLLHGGPNGSNLATWSPFAESLALAGWRVVQPNLRGSGLIDPAVRAPLPERYGVDDADDALSVLRRTAIGPVVVGGMSYGGYLASRVARIAAEVRGVFLLGGFLHPSDLAGSGYPQVKAFLRTAAGRFAAHDPFAAVPHFIAHGERDPRIPAEAVRTHLDDLPSGSQWIAIENEGHGMLSDYAARRVFPPFFSWLDRLG